MNYRRVLSVQDISCFGQCSLTVALPVLSACGHETVILPSALLSTHTTGFDGYTCRDLTDDMPDILRHWQGEEIAFDAIYTGYIQNAKQIATIRYAFDHLLTSNGMRIVDPAMADHGKLYPSFDSSFVRDMRGLVASADVILPNLTEAALLTGTNYRTEYDESYISALANRLRELGAASVILTGVSFDDATTGVWISSDGQDQYYRHPKLPRGSYGTGDVFSSSYVGAYLRGHSAYDAARIAADFTLSCLRNTIDDPSHWYGVKFEPLLGELIRSL